MRVEPTRGQARDSSSEVGSQESRPGPSNSHPCREDLITPFVSESERGGLLSSDDVSSGDESEDEEPTSAPPAERFKLDKGMSSLPKGAIYRNTP